MPSYCPWIGTSALQERLGTFNDLSPRKCRGIQCEGGQTQPGLKGRSARLGSFQDPLRCGTVFLCPGGQGGPLQPCGLGPWCTYRCYHPEPGFSCVWQLPGENRIAFRLFSRLPSAVVGLHPFPPGTQSSQGPRAFSPGPTLAVLEPGPGLLGVCQPLSQVLLCLPLLG